MTERKDNYEATKLCSKGINKYLVHVKWKPVFSHHYFCTMCLEPSAKTPRSTEEERRCRRVPLLTGLRL